MTDAVIRREPEVDELWGPNGAGDDGTVVGRTVAILDAVEGATAPVPLALLTRRTGIPKPTVRRIANALVERGILTRSTQGYSTGPRLIRYGMRAVRQQRIALTVQPYLQDAHAGSRGGMAWFATVDAGELLVTGSVFGRGHRTVFDRTPWPNLGDFGPSVVLTAVGRLHAAHDPQRADRIFDTGFAPLTRYSVTNPNRLRVLLDEAYDTGYAEENEQVLLGWGCMAVALRDAGGRMHGAFGVLGRRDHIATRGLRAGLERLTGDLGRQLTGLHPEQS
ncbi:IclR family transcriptional regulator [Nocardia sp. NPDC052566]|uniref:IclR family transcriptional regulator n=1 Tax=Nocardia sp. NPDC052566 TaxID=3364330 RepID=UPI0037C596E1